MSEAKKLDFTPEDSELDKIESRLARLADVKLALSVELGQQLISVDELLQFDKGTIVDLNKRSDEPLNIYANGSLIALGEITTENGNFGIRIIKIVSSKD